MHINKFYLKSKKKKGFSNSNKISVKRYKIYTETDNQSPDHYMVVLTYIMFVTTQFKHFNIFLTCQLNQTISIQQSSIAVYFGIFILMQELYFFFLFSPNLQRTEFLELRNTKKKKKRKSGLMGSFSPYDGFPIASKSYVTIHI